MWRLADPRFARDLAGTGNRIHGGRWNSAGNGVVYCAENLSLCVLENLVHLPPAMRGSLPPRAAIQLEIPDETPLQDVALMARALKGQKLLKWCRKIGDDWLQEAKFLALRAPSAIVAPEKVVILNPAHPAMREVRIVDIKPFKFDARLF